ncbi:hypothetical protein J4Q44_G00263850 [Coregonus suidteri]|uniref:Uncharacterized protein n=1 Tax=Coregonus suidteri TaxID=861788 RepID=A0AAN8LMC0_9TELE
MESVLLSQKREKVSPLKQCQGRDNPKKSTQQQKENKEQPASDDAAHDGNLTHLPIMPQGFNGGDHPVLPWPGSQRENKLYRGDETAQRAWA